ncbi:hypothetical protein F503_04625 [Ophiostoma piceae UAMH 11346]|uniref:Uncharacterized protein n=1 Tax=Ophiostoma piceae (strain UAMH 11346) TaxID=1262450 RepID=S3CTT4_OPHP1|nr:hypothetical protein F503_04625 [Ophiostoma piceae UAMH 11346]
MNHSAAAPTGAFPQDLTGQLQADRQDSITSIVKNPVRQQEELTDRFPASGLLTNATSHSGDVEMSLDTQDFGGQGMNQFDLDFLLNETDLLSNYLIDA